MSRIYLHRLRPERYPEFTRRTAPAITRASLGDRIQFTTLREFPYSSKSGYNAEKGDAGAHAPLQPGDSLVNVAATIDMYVHHFGLGNVLWPVYPTLFATNFRDLVEQCQREGLYLYDFWGFVPGSKTSEISLWGEYAIPDDVDACMRDALGDHFLGYDNGEQDGRYVHSRARRQAPLSPSRVEQYRTFQAYFEKLFDAMRNHTVTLSSLTFLHYFAKEGNAILIGAETGQALPSSPMWFSFIRGAGKQYGLLYYGNASVWNRWGYKDYVVDSKTPDTSAGFEMGRFAGTSLSLLKRLMYNHYMYNCDVLGFENCWLKNADAQPGDVNSDTTYVIDDKTFTLTPIGEIQRNAVAFVKDHPYPGEMYVPVCVIADFFAGWVPPRHLYTPDVYKVWGSLPYGSGDYQLHALLSMLYPGYENAGYYRDERGFDPATPYGEIADVLLSDVRREIVERYRLAVLLGSVDLTLELFHALKAYVRGGGHVIAFEEMVQRCRGIAAYDGEYDAFFPTARLAAQAFGAGSVAVLPGDGLVYDMPQAYDARNDESSDIAHPVSFAMDVEGYLRDRLADVQLVSVTNPRLRYCVNIRENGPDAVEYCVYVANSGFDTQRFDLRSHAGEIALVEDVGVPIDVEGCEEFLPLLREDAAATATCAGDGAYAIEAGNCRIYRVVTRGQALCEMAESVPEAAAQPLYLRLAPQPSIKDALLAYPTFAHSFRGVLVDAQYLDRLDDDAARREAHYLTLQRIEIVVDLTPMIDHYPDLSLLGNMPERTEASLARIARIIERAALYPLAGVIGSSQRQAENSYTMEQARAALADAFARIEAMCAAHGVPFYLQNRDNAIHSIDEVRAAATKFALNTSFARCEGVALEDVDACDLLMLSGCGADAFGQRYPYNLPTFRAGGDGAERDALRAAFERATQAGVPVVLCGQYADWNEVSHDLEVLRGV